MAAWWKRVADRDLFFFVFFFFFFFFIIIIVTMSIYCSPLRRDNVMAPIPDRKKPWMNFDRPLADDQSAIEEVHGTALHCTALHCTALHCTALHIRDKSRACHEPAVMHARAYLRHARQCEEGRTSITALYAQPLIAPSNHLAGFQFK